MSLPSTSKHGPTSATKDKVGLEGSSPQFPPNPEHKSGFFSQLFFEWVTPMMSKGYRGNLNDQIYDLNEEDKTANVYLRFMKNFLNPSNNQRTLVTALNKTLLVLFIKSAIYRGFADALQFAGPMFLKYIVRFVADPTRPSYEGYVFAVALLVSSLLRSWSLQHSMHMNYKMSCNSVSVLTEALYEKSLRLSSAARRTQNAGKITNLMTIDTMKVMMFVTMVHFLWASPATVIVSIILVCVEVGWVGLIGPAILFAAIPIQGKLIGAMGKIRRRQAAITDERVKLLTEFIMGMRIVKYYAWEKLTLGRVTEVRKRELKLLRTQAFMRTWNEVLLTVAPILVPIGVFGAYAGLGNPLQAEKIFTVLALFAMFQIPLRLFPQTLFFLVDAKASLKRMNDFYESEDLQADTIRRDDPSMAVGEVRAQDVSFSWEEGINALHSLNFTVTPGTLTAVVGPVGSGKSSLTSAFVGEMVRTGGTLSLKGSIAYVPQQAWVKNASLKDNILFGRPLDVAKYEEVLRVCELTSDLAILPAGDMTEIGERGINLSGGQKQRVSIARAVYAEADVYILDDCLSALDAHVAKAIFDNVIRGALRNKTRILVTHALHFLPEADQILVMLGGSIAEIGTYNALMAADKDFATLVRTHAEAQEEVKEEHATAKAVEVSAATLKSVPAALVPTAASAVNAAAGVDKSALMQKETRAFGSVGLGLYRVLIRASEAPLLCATVFLLFCLAQATRQGNDYWLTVWTSDKVGGASLGFYLGIYALFAFGAALASLSRGLTFTLATLKASTNLQLSCVTSVLRAPLSFFDTTPVGRIINRLSGDQDAVDVSLPQFLGASVQTGLAVLGAFIFICILLPLFLTALPFMIFVYRFIMLFYLRTSREIKRYESVSRSPLFAHFNETITGITTIRAYGLENRFIAEVRERLDVVLRALFAGQNLAQRWLTIRLEAVSAFAVFATAIFSCLAREFGQNAADIGLALSWSLQITQLLSISIRFASDSEIQMNSVERIYEYAKSLPAEAPFVIPDQTPPSDWPSTGNIVVRDLSMRYRPELDPVLKSISFEVRPQEKVGIVGRTGSGKSSLTLALLRVVEASAGSIVIDGIDVRTIGLHDLRGRIAIIPQDPVLFNGTIRSNLDPFNNHSDEALWRVLELVDMKEPILKANTEMGKRPNQNNTSGQPQATNGQVTAQRSQPKKAVAVKQEAVAIEMTEVQNNGVNLVVSSGGDNFSVGQRQLLCLARALLRKPKILIMDEATASVDVATDALIQKMVREQFSNCSVLTIAHRLHTIIQSDRVLVLSQGEIVEYDAPLTLLDKPGGAFASLVAENGAMYAEKMRQLALSKGSVPTEDVLLALATEEQDTNMT